MKFEKIGAVWYSKNKDKNGLPYMSGIIDGDREIHKGEKVFVFQTNPANRRPKSPVATIVIGVDGEQYQPGLGPEPEKEAEPMPDPLPDDGTPL